jgi:hypothetical protein
VLEVAQIRQRRRLMDDRVRLGLEDGLAHGARVEQVEGDRMGPERAQPLGVAGRAERADHLVPSVDQLGNEPAADGAARSCDEDSHRVLLSDRVTSPCRGGSIAMTRDDGGT